MATTSEGMNGKDDKEHNVAQDRKTKDIYTTCSINGTVVGSPEVLLRNGGLLT